MVVGAQVHATNVATNTKASSVTNNEGNYELPYLLPGVYRVSAELSGFKKMVRDGIEVRVSDRLSLDLVLQVGDVAESVVVTGETPLLDSSNASLGTVLDERRVSDLPVVGGNAFYLARLSAGLNSTGGHTAGNPSDYGAATGMAVNGAGNKATEVTLDGSPDMYKGNAAYSPPQDLVQEFKIQTTTYDASLGHAAGAVVNVSMKSGTNQLHGTGYGFGSWIRAVPWFSNKYIYDPTTGPITPEKKASVNPGWLHERWGGTLTGPVVIPKVYDGRNRTFFSTGFEMLYIRRQTSFTGTVPTPEELNGDFSALLALGSKYQIYDPFTIASAGKGRFSRQPLPGNIIPASRIDPVARKILSYYPAPNKPGTVDFRQNFFRIANEDKDYLSTVTRIDHNFSERNRFFARFNQNEYDLKKKTLPSIATGDITNQKGWGTVLDDVYVFNPQLLLNVRYGITVMAPIVSRESQGMDLLSLGFPQSMINEIFTKNQPGGIAFPAVDIQGLTSLSNNGGNTRRTLYQTLGGTVTKLSGNHSFRFGAEFRLMRDNGFGYGNVAPYFNFTANWAKGPMDNSPAAPIGQGLAAMLFGLPGSGRINNNASRAEQSTFTSLFLQDDWKLSRKLTLNVGLRYEFEGAITERYNRSLRGFDFQSHSPIEAQAKANYAAAPIPEVPVDRFQTIGGLTFPGVNAPRGLWSPDPNNFAPRIGLAYQLTSKTVVRAGYGIFFDLLGIDQQDVNLGGFNQPTNFIASNDNGLHYVASLSNPFPNGIEVPMGAAGGLNTFLGRGVTFFNDHQLNPYMQRWSFSLQQEFPWRVLMEASYVGNRGTKIASSHELNPVPRQYLSTSPTRDDATNEFLTTQVKSPFTGMEQFVGTGLYNTNVARSQLLRPYPQFTSIATSLPDGFSWYHSLQMTAEKRLSKGLSFQASYTFSKFMQAVGFLNDTDPRQQRVISDLDFPHRFTVSAIYELPFGHRRQLLSNAGWLLDALVGGWQVQGSYEGQSGDALGFGNSIFYGNLHDLPLAKDQRSVEQWFNINAGFERDSNKQLVNNIQGLSSRFNGLRGDGINNFDMSMFKNFRITEGAKAQFRIESYNAMNHPQFDNPNTNPDSTAFGIITAEKGHGQRQLTFAIKVMF